MSDNLILKITEGELFRFFDSESLTRFSLGSKRTNAVVVRDALVLPEQILFDNRNGVWYVMDLTPFDAKSEVLLNGKRLKKPVKCEGELVIRKKNDKKAEAVVRVSVVKKIARRRGSSKTLDLTRKTVTVIGRAETCDLVVRSPQVSAQHCRIIFDGETCYVEDLHSINGTYVNNRKIKRAKLSDYDRISISSAAYTYFDKKLLYSTSAGGIGIDVVNISREVQDRNAKGKRVRLVSDVSFSVKAGDFVAIVGGSGAGKSTILDCINGLRPATRGRIFYDTNDYYDNINSYKGVIGYVPQRDVMHDDLSVEEGLYYTALIRMRTDLKREEVRARVAEAIEDVKLTGKEKLKISSLSGGQRKRVSIAMELLSDPKVIFLDEPTSGLSPDLDLEMMALLKELAGKGRTIVVITHAMENLDKCDKIAFLGKGGRLCYYGSHEGVFRYFNRKSYSRIFAALTEEKICRQFEKKYRSTEAYKSMMKKFAELYGEELLTPSEPPEPESPTVRSSGDVAALTDSAPSNPGTSDFPDPLEFPASPERAPEDSDFSAPRKPGVPDFPDSLDFPAPPEPLPEEDEHEEI